MSLRTRRLSAGRGRGRTLCLESDRDRRPAAGGAAAADIWAPYDVAGRRQPRRRSRRVGVDARRRRAASSPRAEQQAQLAALERDAFTKGYAQGERAGLEAGGKRAEAMLRRLAQTLEELSGLRDNMVRQTERELVQLSVAIARRILQREVSVDPELTAALAHIALERLGGAAPATVRLHPDDYTIVTAGQVTPLGGRQVEILPDPSVSRGGCLVESEFGYINASVDAQVDEIARAVLGERGPRRPRASGSRLMAVIDFASGFSLARYHEQVKAADPLPMVGQVVRTVGLLVESQGPARPGRRAVRTRLARRRAAADARGRRLPRQPAAVGAARQHHRASGRAT